jgi:hypothetical protein
MAIDFFVGLILVKVIEISVVIFYSPKKLSIE